MALLGDFSSKFSMYFQQLAHQNPYSTEQGFFLRITGQKLRETGIFSGEHERRSSASLLLLAGEGGPCVSKGRMRALMPS
jgi:hypothetical protein